MSQDLEWPLASPVQSAGATVMLGLKVKHTMLGMIIGRSWLVPMSSLSRNEGKTVFHSFCISLLRFEPQSLVPWKGLAVRKTWTQTLITKSCCWVIQVRSSKFRGFGVLLVKIETVSSQGPVFKDQVIWNNAHERHVQYIHMVLFSVKRGSSRDFSSTPVVKTSKAGGIDVIPGRGTKTPRA